MRSVLLAGFHSTVGNEGPGFPLIGRKARLFAAGAAVLALGVNPATVLAANVPVMSQDSEDSVALGLWDGHFTNDDKFELTLEERANAEAFATANATILAGISQASSVGTAGAGDLSVDNSGSILIGALAEATGDVGAFATAAIMGGVLQSVTGSGGAISFDNSGKLEVLAVASADAMGSQETDTGFANALAIGNFAHIGPTATTPTGTGTGTGTTAIVGATALPGSAAIQMSNEGKIDVDAVANASADGNAYAFATALYGMVGQATAAGDVDVTLVNDGDLGVSAIANAVGGHAATAIAQGIGGLVAVANATGTGDAHADVVNNGALVVRADAHADATTNAWVGAIGVTAVWEVAHAAQGDASVSMTNSGSIDVIADAVASALVAQATAQGGAGGIFGGAILQSAAASVGDAYGFFDNEGEISVVANASAHGSVIAYANAYGGPGVIQRVWSGGIASADVGNSGSISVVAHALATATNSAIAHASNGFGVMAVASGLDQATAEFANSGTVTIGAVAEADGPNWGTADAALGRAMVVGSRTNNGNALSQLTNSGAIEVAASALAEGEFAAATAAMLEAIVEQATAVGGTAHAGFGNSGNLSFVANAGAQTSDADGFGTALAQATAFNAIAQQALGMAQTTPSFAVGDASVELENVGTIEVGVHVSAEGEAVGNANAMLSGGLVQTVYTGQFAPVDAIASDLLGSATLSNGGDIALVASAEAAGSSAVAVANLVAGISQVANAALGDGALNVTNGGSIAIHAGAEASEGELFSRANAVVYGAFFQSVNATLGSADIGFDNAGEFEITAGAQAEGEDLVVAFAQALGGNQQALAGEDGVAAVSFDNAGDYVVHAAAQATLVAADDATGVTFANAGAQASGLYQFSNHGSVSFANSGTFDIAAGAQSKGEQADGFAMALGVNQGVAGHDGAVSFDNSGEFKVKAGYSGDDKTGTGFVIASGYRATGEALSVDVKNGGDVRIVASAEAAEGASAGAVGFAIQAAVATSAPESALLAGSLSNSGDLAVLATASGGIVTTGWGSTAHEVPGSNATATGIALLSGVNTMTLSNSGAISVDAVTGHGGAAAAYGIRVAGNGTGAPGSDADIFTINNSGDIIARVSDDGGKTWHRGTAIDLASAPGSAVVNLAGGGRITGNIALGADQTINVTTGETWFDGVINGGCIACGQGTLNIGSGGSLYLRYNAVDGSSGASLEEFNMSSTGKLILELGGASPGSDYPRIMADVANLDGVLLVRLGPKPFKDSIILADLIDADVRNGQFDSCGIDGKKVLLQASCTYDGQGNVDLAITRVKFNAVGGLNASQLGAASGIEAIYNAELDGPFADIVGQLFTFDEDDYQIALNQLSGASHASYLQSFHSLGVRQNELIDRATGCELPGSNQSSLSCRTSKLNLWGQIDYNGRHNDGNLEAAAYEADRWTAAIGGDVALGQNAVLGASLAKLSNHVDFDDDARSDADGHELGVYGVFDPGNFYAKVLGTMAWFDGDSRRRINFEPIGGTLAGQLTGDPDVRVWTLGAHLGYRVPLGSSSLLTPFLNIDHSSARLDGFTESELAGANLVISNSSSSQTALTVGAKWAGRIGQMVPQAELGYRYRFGDLRSTMHAAFAADEDSDFDVVSATEKRGSLLTGFSLGSNVGPVDLRVGYEGVFDGNATSHSANVRIILPLGGRWGREPR